MDKVAAYRPELTARTFERILIVKPSSLGDIIHTLPVLHGLRVRYPEAAISWLVATSLAPLIAGNPELDEVISFDRRQYAMIGRKLGPTGRFAEFVGSLRARRFDLVIDLQGLFRSGFLSMATGAPVRIGFAQAREMAWIFYTHRIPAQHCDMHAAERNCLVGGLLGFGPGPMVFDLAVTAAEREAAVAAITHAGIDPAEPFMAVLPGTRWETKRWSASRFAATIDAVMKEHGTKSLLLASPDEGALCREIVLEARSAPANLAGRTGIRELVAILERASVVLAQDSAPMHMAAALGRPLVAILGPTNRHRTGPYQMPDSVVQADLPCVPCYLKRLSQCPYDHRCMCSVEVADVARRVGEGLGAAPGRGGSSAGNVVSIVS